MCQWSGGGRSAREGNAESVKSAPAGVNSGWHLDLNVSFPFTADWWSIRRCKYRSESQEAANPFPPHPLCPFPFIPNHRHEAVPCHFQQEKTHPPLPLAQLSYGESVLCIIKGQAVVPGFRHSSSTHFTSSSFALKNGGGRLWVVPSVLVYICVILLWWHTFMVVILALMKIFHVRCVFPPSFTRWLWRTTDNQHFGYFSLTTRLQARASPDLNELMVLVYYCCC